MKLPPFTFPHPSENQRGSIHPPRAVQLGLGLEEGFPGAPAVCVHEGPSLAEQRELPLVPMPWGSGWFFSGSPVRPRLLLLLVPIS